MTYSELLEQLKKNAPYDQAQVAQLMVTQLVTVLQQQRKNPDPMLDQLAQTFHGHTIASLRLQWSVRKFFTGNGPIAQKLREHAAITRYFGMGSHKLDVHLSLFDFGAEAAQDASFVNWLKEVSMNTFGKHFDATDQFPVEPCVEMEMETGIHVEGRAYQGEATPRILVLSAELPNGIKVIYSVRSEGLAKLLYWHPHEGTWLTDDGRTNVPGVQQALAKEWGKVADEAGYSPNPLDLNAEIAQISEKAAKIFDQENLLPEHYTHYVRVSAEESYLRFVIENYHLVFINTKGAYASRAMSLTMNMGDAHSTTVGFKDLREFARQEIFKQVNAGLDDLIQKFIDVPRVSMDMTAGTAIPSTNPVRAALAARNKAK